MGLDSIKQSVAEKYAGGDLIAGLMDRLGSSARSEVVFGSPIERDSVTVIPVARIRYGMGFGFGGGGRTKRTTPAVEGGGGGGGGGAHGEPVGFIEVTASRARFVPIANSRPTLFILIGFLLATFFACVFIFSKGPRRGN